MAKEYVSESVGDNDVELNNIVGGSSIDIKTGEFSKSTVSKLVSLAITYEYLPKWEKGN